MSIMVCRDSKTGNAYAFNPLMIASVCEHGQVDGKICVEFIGNGEDGAIVFNYDIEVALDKWRDALKNS